MAHVTFRNTLLLHKKTRLFNYFQFVSSVSLKHSSSSSSQSSLEPVETEIHTGQKWDRNDYRLVRFVDRPKQVNTKFAIKLIDEEPPAPRKERIVWCDGGGGPTGHPKVYINLKIRVLVQFLSPTSWGVGVPSYLQLEYDSHDYFSYCVATSDEIIIKDGENYVMSTTNQE
ncbi:hypothetical protein ANN_11066 [Periplaneta americana]|uniref:Zinc finger CHCC-type domain-containing protein n=1 Tax=Periplaneta americana TaxID=6978 RepID=A0ABQ8T5R0_PERAM|nr:hypothetical protein ANN_11066 [Periplaneta americana]